MKTALNFLTCRPGFISFIFLVAAFQVIFNFTALSQEPEIQKHTFQFEWGNNIWGNSLSLGYDYHFSKKVYAGLSIGSGYMRYSFDENGNAFFFEGAPGKKNSFSMDFKQMIDLRFGFVLKQPNGFSLFDKFETGISYNHFILTDEYADYYENIWKGNMEFTMYGLLLDMELLNYRPEKEKHLDFGFGIKSKFTVTGPQEMRYDSYGHLPKYIPFEQNGNRDMLFWAYPEFYLKINYSL